MSHPNSVNRYTSWKTLLYKANFSQWLGIFSILCSGLVHLYNAPGEYREAPYMGGLFYAFFLGSILSAFGIYRGALFTGWTFGAVLSIGAIVGYLLSRTVGLPLMEVESWGPPLAYFSVILELVFFIPFLLSTKIYKRRSH